MTCKQLGLRLRLKGSWRTVSRFRPEGSRSRSRGYGRPPSAPPPGPYVDSRFTSSVGRITAAGSSPPIWASSTRTISVLMRSHGCRMVVSAGLEATAAGESSKPPTATSSRHPPAGPLQRRQHALRPSGRRRRTPRRGPGPAPAAARHPASPLARL